MDILTPPLLKIGQLNTKEIFLIGFDDAAFGVLNKYKNGSRTYKFNRLNTSFSAYNALKNKIENNLPQEYPRAILCDAHFLAEEDFRLIKKLQSDVVMKDIPFITISTINKDKDQITKHAFQNRIDDHYSLADVEWNKLKKRIEFLNKFKPELNELVGSSEMPFQPYKTPFKKRLFDILFASAALIALSPLLIAVAIAVKLESKGNIFYTSKRAGSGYNTFGFIKFRSMCNDADSKLVELAHLNQYGAKTGGPTFVKIQDDPRVTKVGKFIRKTSIDELPQLFNVLKGDMSIVGNRPLPLYEAELLTKDNWITRFNAPAGLTGLWQISKRGKKEMSAEERIQLDIDYAKKYSVRMDLKILLKTLPAMIQDEQV